MYVFAAACILVPLLLALVLFTLVAAIQMLCLAYAAKLKYAARSSPLLQREVKKWRKNSARVVHQWRHWISPEVKI